MIPFQPPSGPQGGASPFLEILVIALQTNHILTMTAAL